MVVQKWTCHGVQPRAADFRMFVAGATLEHSLSGGGIRNSNNQAAKVDSLEPQGRAHMAHAALQLPKQQLHPSHPCLVRKCAVSLVEVYGCMRAYSSFSLYRICNTMRTLQYHYHYDRMACHTNFITGPEPLHLPTYPLLTFQ